VRAHEGRSLADTSEAHLQEERERQDHERDAALAELEAIPFVALRQASPLVAAGGSAIAFGREEVSREGKKEKPGPGATEAGASGQCHSAAGDKEAQAGSPFKAGTVRTGGDSLPPPNPPNKPPSFPDKFVHRFRWGSVATATFRGGRLPSVGEFSDLDVEWDGRMPRNRAEREELNRWLIGIQQAAADASGVRMLHGGPRLFIINPHAEPEPHDLAGMIAALLARWGKEER